MDRMPMGAGGHICGILSMILAVMFGVISTIVVLGDEFQVSTASVLAEVLVQTATNGEENFIIFAPGLYEVNFSSQDRDGESLVIQGAEGTTSEKVILDGSGKDLVIALFSPSEGVKVILSNLAVQNVNIANAQGVGIQVVCIDVSIRLGLRLAIAKALVKAHEGEDLGRDLPFQGDNLLFHASCGDI